MESNHGNRSNKVLVLWKKPMSSQGPCNWLVTRTSESMNQSLWSDSQCWARSLSLQLPPPFPAHLLQHGVSGCSSESRKAAQPMNSDASVDCRRPSISKQRHAGYNRLVPVWAELCFDNPAPPRSRRALACVSTRRLRGASAVVAAGCWPTEGLPWNPCKCGAARAQLAPMRGDDL